jgi:hypothetical protein
MISHDYVSPEITRLQVHFAFHFYIWFLLWSNWGF